MQLTILTPEKELYNGMIKSVKVPGTTGQFQVLKGHAPIVASLEAGTVYVVDEGGTKHNFEIVRGFVEVYRNEVSVLATTEAPVKEES